MHQSEATFLTVPSMPFDENTYIAYFHARNDCLVVDPGLDPEAILTVLDNAKRKPAAILCTHGHADHIAGNAVLKQRWPQCPLVIGKGDAPKLIDPELNLSAGFGLSLTSPEADRTVSEGDVLELAGFQLEVFELPGHSAGHVVFVVRNLQPKRVFGGDVLFAGSVGRTDFPDGSFALLKRSIHEKLFSLPDETIVLPGHGPPTSVGREKQTNPFVGLESQFEG